MYHGLWGISYINVQLFVVHNNNKAKQHRSEFPDGHQFECGGKLSCPFNRFSNYIFSVNAIRGARIVRDRPTLFFHFRCIFSLAPNSFSHFFFVIFTAKAQQRNLYGFIYLFEFIMMMNWWSNNNNNIFSLNCDDKRLALLLSRLSACECMSDLIVSRKRTVPVWLFVSPFIWLATATAAAAVAPAATARYSGIGTYNTLAVLTLYMPNDAK